MRKNFFSTYVKKSKNCNKWAEFSAEFEIAEKVAEYFSQRKFEAENFGKQ